jgi:CelD/BcsL family acetyltransferase involved in cellulose biosynthesis
MGQGFIYNEETLKRFRLEAAHNRLRAYVLYLHGQPKAFWIGIVYEGVFHAGYTGYDPDLRDHELGTLLFVFMVDQLAGEAVKKFDFGLGDALYKQRFGDESWREVTYSLYALSPKGLALAVLGTVNVLLSQSARWLLARLGMFYRLKKYWRKRLIKSEQETES